MANIKFQVKGSGICSISVRFYSGNNFRCQSVTGLMIPAQLWNAKNQSVRQSESFDSLGLQSQLNALKSFILARFNHDYALDIVIDSLWLKNVISAFNNKDKSLSDRAVSSYFCTYIKKYIKDCGNRINIHSGKKLADSTVFKYQNVLDRLREYEQSKNIKLQHLDIGTHFYKDFMAFLSLNGKYSHSTMKKFISIVRTFCKEAQTEGIKINPSSVKPLPIKDSQNTDIPYLNESEIQLLADLDLKTDEKSDHIRDMFIIQLWTGLRASDLITLTTENIFSETIEIVSTQKTGATAKIPIHPMVKSILNKRNGKLPNFCSASTYNKKIKELCKKAGINQIIAGAKINSETKRKEKGFYPKYELISSHSARRSFVSNLYQKVSDETLKSLTTHKSNTQLLQYVKITQDEHIQAVKQLWAS